jgi:hypothetical protein
MATGLYIYTLEGWVNAAASDNIVRRYDGAANVWRADLAAPPFTGQLVSFDADIRMQGAYDGAYWYVIGADGKLYRYNPTLDSWSAALAGGVVLPVGGTPEDHPFLMTSDGRFVYIMDGPSKTGSTSSTFRKYDPQGNSLSTLTGMIGGQVFSWGKSLLVWDGADGIYSTHGDVATSTFYRYSISGNTWTALAAPPAALLTMSSGTGVCWGGFLQGKLYYLGQSGGVCQAFQYNPSGDTWTVKATQALSFAIQGAQPFGEIDDNRIIIFARDTNQGGAMYDVGANTWSAMTFSVYNGAAQGGNFAVSKRISPGAIWYASDGTTLLDVSQVLGTVAVGGTITYHAVVKLNADRPGGVTIRVLSDAAQDADDAVTLSATSGGSYTTSFATAAVVAGQAIDVYLKVVPTLLQTQGTGKTFQLDVS